MKKLFLVTVLLILLLTFLYCEFINPIGITKNIAGTFVTCPLPEDQQHLVSESELNNSFCIELEDGEVIMIGNPYNLDINKYLNNKITVTITTSFFLRSKKYKINFEE